MHEILKTISYASEAHKNQTRKNGGAYICHPVRVAEALAEAGVQDLLTLQVALLHDTIEDTDTTYQDLYDLFGGAVADGVSELTDDKTLPKMTRKRLCIEHAPHLSPSSALVKIADVSDNSSTILSLKDRPEGWTQERCHAYGVWASEVINGALNTLDAQGLETAKALIPSSHPLHSLRLIKWI